jgi:hypothetical protein
MGYQMLKHKKNKNRDGQEITYRQKKKEELVDTFDWDGFWKECLDDATSAKKLEDITKIYKNYKKTKVKKEKKVEKDGKKKKRR